MRIVHPITLSSLTPSFLSLVDSLCLQILAFAMSGASGSESVELAEDAADFRFGFSRPEMYSKNLAGTVEPYERHLFLCYKSPESWSSHLEKSEAEPLVKRLCSALKSRKHDMAVATRLAICEEHDGALFSQGDVLIFPDMIKYKSLKESDVDSFVDDVLVKGKPRGSGVQEVLTGSHVFVCVHASRDQRCGVCGPPLIEKFKEEVEVRGLKDQVFISACSHIGGHKYAGNLIIFSPNMKGDTVGHWYGYVCPTDVNELLDLHIGKGEIIERLWRGQMGGVKKINFEITEINGDTGTGCCQNGGGGAKEFSCCQNGGGVAKEFSCSEDNQSKTGVENEQEALQSQGWLDSCELSNVFGAIGFLGVVATVAVAYYGFYKKSR